MAEVAVPDILVAKRVTDGLTEEEKEEYRQVFR